MTAVVVGAAAKTNLCILNVFSLIKKDIKNKIFIPTLANRNNTLICKKIYNKGLHSPVPSIGSLVSTKNNILKYNRDNQRPGRCLS